MTNREVIKLFAEYKPELIAEMFDDCYITGLNDGAYNEIHKTSIQNCPIFELDWLDKEYDKNWWKEYNVEEALEWKKNEST